MLGPAKKWKARGRLRTDGSVVRKRRQRRWQRFTRPAASLRVMKTDLEATPGKDTNRHHPLLSSPSSGMRRPRFQSPASLAEQMPGTHHIELSLQSIDQLFNTMDPSPFHEKDLDDNAAEFILSWAQEFHRPEPVDLIVHLEKMPEGHNAQRLIEDAIHHYFNYRARLNELEFKRLMKQGRQSLTVGVSFLVACFLAIEFIGAGATSTFWSFFNEGLTIAGWVAMWRPLEIYLYEWWPLRRRGQILDKLSHMAVEVRKRG